MEAQRKKGGKWSRNKSKKKQAANTAPKEDTEPLLEESTQESLVSPTVDQPSSSMQPTAVMQAEPREHATDDRASEAPSNLTAPVTSIASVVPPLVLSCDDVDKSDLGEEEVQRHGEDEEPRASDSDAPSITQNDLIDLPEKTSEDIERKVDPSVPRLWNKSSNPFLADQPSCSKQLMDEVEPKTPYPESESDRAEKEIEDAGLTYMDDVMEIASDEETAVLVEALTTVYEKEKMQKLFPNLFAATARETRPRRHSIGESTAGPMAPACIPYESSSPHRLTNTHWETWRLIHRQFWSMDDVIPNRPVMITPRSMASEGTERSIPLNVLQLRGPRASLKSIKTIEEKRAEDGINIRWTVRNSRELSQWMGDRPGSLPHGAFVDLIYRAFVQEDLRRHRSVYMTPRAQMMKESIEAVEIAESALLEKKERFRREFNQLTRDQQRAFYRTERTTHKYHSDEEEEDYVDDMSFDSMGGWTRSVLSFGESEQDQTDDEFDSREEYPFKRNEDWTPSELKKENKLPENCIIKKAYIRYRQLEIHYVNQDSKKVKTFKRCRRTKRERELFKNRAPLSSIYGTRNALSTLQMDLNAMFFQMVDARKIEYLKVSQFTISNECMAAIRSELPSFQFEGADVLVLSTGMDRTRKTRARIRLQFLYPKCFLDGHTFKFGTMVVHRWMSSSDVLAIYRHIDREKKLDQYFRPFHNELGAIYLKVYPPMRVQRVNKSYGRLCRAVKTYALVEKFNTHQFDCLLNIFELLLKDDRVMDLEIDWFYSLTASTDDVPYHLAHHLQVVNEVCWIKKHITETERQRLADIWNEADYCDINEEEITLCMNKETSIAKKALFASNRQHGSLLLTVKPDSRCVSHTVDDVVQYQACPYVVQRETREKPMSSFKYKLNKPRFSSYLKRMFAHHTNRVFGRRRLAPASDAEQNGGLAPANVN